MTFDGGELIIGERLGRADCSAAFSSSLLVVQSVYNAIGWVLWEASRY